MSNVILSFGVDPRLAASYATSWGKSVTVCCFDLSVVFQGKVADLVEVSLGRDGMAQYVQHLNQSTISTQMVDQVFEGIVLKKLGLAAHDIVIVLFGMNDDVNYSHFAYLARIWAGRHCVMSEDLLELAA